MAPLKSEVGGLGVCSQFRDAYVIFMFESIFEFQQPASCEKAWASAEPPVQDELCILQQLTVQAQKVNGQFEDQIMLMFWTFHVFKKGPHFVDLSLSL